MAKPIENAQGRTGIDNLLEDFWLNATDNTEPNPYRVACDTAKYQLKLDILGLVLSIIRAEHGPNSAMENDFTKAIEEYFR